MKIWTRKPDAESSDTSAKTASSARPFPGKRAVIVGDASFMEEARLERFQGMHPSWAADLRAFGPWERRQNMLVAARSLEHRIVCLQRSASTMEAVRELAGAGRLRPGDAVVAAVQERGRGQLRRGWQSYPGNLHVSVLLSTPSFDVRLPDKAVGLLPHALGLHCCQVLRTLCSDGEHSCGLSVKWPNDLLCDNRKIGGILVEERQGAIVAGIGINLVAAPSENELRSGYAVPAGRLPEKVFSGFGPLGLWERLSMGLLPFLRNLKDDSDREEMLRNYEFVMAFLGRRVGVRDGERAYEGVLTGVAPDGGLKLVLGGQDLGRKVVLYSGSLFLL